MLRELFLTQFKEKCRQCTVYCIKKHTVKTKAFLYSAMHNSAKRYWGVEVKFPFNEAHSRCGHAGIKKNRGHPAMFKMFVESTFYVFFEGEGGVRIFGVRF